MSVDCKRRARERAGGTEREEQERNVRERVSGQSEGSRKSEGV